MLRAKGHGLAGYRNIQNTSAQCPGAKFIQLKDEQIVHFPQMRGKSNQQEEEQDF